MHGLNCRIVLFLLFFRTTNDRIINVSCASLTPFGVIYGSQVCEWGFIPNSHAWFPYATTSNFARRRCAIGLPYITPNGVRMAVRKIIDGHFWRKKQRHLCRNIASCASPTPKGVIYGHSKNIIYEHLWLIDGHFWPKKTKTFMSKKKFYDEKTKYYYITLPFNMVILAHLIRNTLPSITIILFHHISFYFFVNKKSID